MLYGMDPLVFFDRCHQKVVWYRFPLPPQGTRETPKIVSRNIADISNLQPKSDQVVPVELQETMRKTVAYPLDFILDTLDYSSDEPSVLAGEADLGLWPSSDYMMEDQFCFLLLNDEKYPFDDVVELMEATNRTREEANETAVRIDEQGRDIIDMHPNASRLLKPRGLSHKSSLE